MKYASAHDLRRAFGERWAARIMPAQLRELMRHESIETTLRYYVGTNAERTADACWVAFEKTDRGAAPAPAPSTGSSLERKLAGVAASSGLPSPTSSPVLRIAD